jgi:hypothetical protein
MISSSREALPLPRSETESRVRPFLVCIHDATPVYDRQTRIMIRDLAPLVGRSVSFGVVPDWHGGWPITSHPDYCDFLQQSSSELLLHGCMHTRRRGRGVAGWLAEGSDEMNGLTPEETRQALEYGQQLFEEAFGARARGFLAPAWQQGHAGEVAAEHAMDFMLGFFAVRSLSGASVALSTSTWDCGRWSGLGHAGHGIGWLLRLATKGVPALAIHPRDLDRGYWPTILRLTRSLLHAGYVPTTAASLLKGPHAEIVV